MRKIKTTKLIIVLLITLAIAACSASKKTASSPATPASTITRAAPSTNYLFIKPADGIHAPGNEELTAAQTQYNDITLAQLTEGYSLYTTATCIRCHDAKNIYALETAKWKGILDDMAQKANISDDQKDAVYKYVLAIKATQPK